MTTVVAEDDGGPRLSRVARVPSLRPVKLDHAGVITTIAEDEVAIVALLLRL